jgi:hypothetical protein
MLEMDFSDSAMVWQFGCETVTLAEKASEAREKYATALKDLRIELAKAYNDGSIKDSMSEDKAFVKLSTLSKELEEAMINYTVKEQEYKGLEKLVDTRNGLLKFNASLVQNQPK